MAKEYRVYVSGKGIDYQILPIRELGRFAIHSDADKVFGVECARLIKSGYLFDSCYVKWGDTEISEYRRGPNEARYVSCETITNK